MPTATITLPAGAYSFVNDGVAGTVNVIEIQTEFGVSNVGDEPVITATDGNVSVTLANGDYDGTYTTRATDGATLTVTMIAAAPTPIVLPTFSGVTTQGEVLTGVSPVFLFAGTDPQDLAFSWVNNTDGATGTTALAYTAVAGDVGDTLKLSATFGGVTVDSVNTNEIVGSAGFSPLSLGAKLHTWLDFTDTAVLYQDTARTAVVTTDSQAVLGVDDKSGNNRHYTAPVATTEFTWDATGEQVSSNGAALMYFEADDVLVGATSTMEVYLAVKTADSSWVIMGVKDEFLPYFAQASDGSSLGPSNGSGTPVYSTNLVNNGAATRDDLHTAWVTDAGLVAGANTVDISGWQASGHKLQILNGRNNSQQLSPGYVTHFIIASALTSGERSDLATWLGARLPV